MSLPRKGRRRGEALNANPPTIGWALSRVPDEPHAPDGMRLERVDREWMNRHKQEGVFTNALGLPEQSHRAFRNQYAFALFDAVGAPAAIAGVYDTAGLPEIGVDVRRDHRGRGLAPIVVGAAARAILDAGGTPFYECAAANTRSQRTALSCGFLPACSVALAYPAGLGIEQPGS